MKLARKVLFYLVLVFAVAALSLVASAFLFKDQITKQFIKAANEKLSTPVKIGTIDVTVFHHFPLFSIVLKDVYVEDSHEGQYPLLTASQISFQLNPLEVYQGNYIISGLEVINGEANLKINQQGKSNYVIVKNDSSTNGSSIGFELKNVQLKNTLVQYSDFSANQHLRFSSEQLTTSIKNEKDVYAILAKGQVTSKQIKINKKVLLEEKAFEVDAHLTYNDLDKILLIEPSDLTIKKSEFDVKGSYQWKTSPFIDLKINGKKTNLQTLLSLLPEETYARFAKYQSKGDAFFSSTLKGPITAKKNPTLSVEFGLSHATITHPDTKAQIDSAAVEGSFAATDITKLNQASLVLKNMTGSFNHEPFVANLIINDFTDSEVIFNFKGAIDAASLTSFYPIQEINDLTGKFLVDVSFEGKLSWLKSKATAQQAATSGTVEMQQVNFNYGEKKLAIQNLNGVLQFNNNDLALSNVSVLVGNSDFLVNGFFKNIVTFLLFENQPIGIEADLKSKYLDVDQLFAIGYSEGRSKEYMFNIPANLNLNFNCRVETLNYKQFSARQLVGDLIVQNQVAASKNIQLNTMGGSLTLAGMVNASNNKAISIMTTSHLKDIHVDSAFFVFKNFNQDFIEDKNLKGQADADVTMELTLNEKLKLFPETLTADISAVIRNGELNHFEPLKSLNKYLDDEGLSALRFAELKNDIHIENKTVYIPQMEVRSNVTTLQISGTHTFDQQIDYRIVTPLINKKKPVDVEALKAVEEQGGQLKLFLKITGTASDYRVQYDTEAVRKKIAADFKKEVKELKEAFKNKGEKKKKELELSTEEFEWEN